MHTTSTRKLSPAPASLLVLALAGCGGGGGGGQVAGTKLNEGVYDVSAFNYVDPKPASFHPLLKPTVKLSRRDEIVCLFKSGASAFEIEDAITGTPPTSIGTSMTDGLQVIDGASGDRNGDGRPDLVLVGTTTAPGNRAIRVRSFQRISGIWTLLESFDLGAPEEDYDVARISLGNLDGDASDELIVAATFANNTKSWVRILDDAVAAPAVPALLQSLDFPTGREVRAIAADLDDDPASELVVHVGSFASTAEGFAYDDLANPLGMGAGISLYSVTDALSVDLVALNRDNDPRDEIAVLFTKNDQMVLSTWDDAVAGLPLIHILSGSAFDPGLWSATDPSRIRRIDAGDMDGDGREELAYLVTRLVGAGGGTPMTHLRVHWSSKESIYWFLFETTEKPLPFSPVVAWDLELVDRNADGKEEAVAMFTYNGGCGGGVFRHDVVDASHLDFSWLDGFAVAGTSQVVLAGDDFDGDGVALKWKGHKSLNLTKPIPVVLLAAPPTKAGISQNYDGSSVGYETSSGYGFAASTKMGVSYSLGLGLEADDPITQSGASVKATFKAAVELSLGVETSITTSVSFEGTHEDDVVIFQGTLHMVYEYEVVASKDPTQIGKLVTVNQPLETKLYKWTRKFFEETFGPDSTVSFGHWSHAVGDPTSYPKKADAEQLVADAEGLLGGFMGDSVTVGQGKGTNGLELALEKKLTASEEWTFELEGETELKIGGAQLTVTQSLSFGYVVELSATKGTKYGAKIGDIAKSEDYFQWGYDTGLFTYRYESAKGIPIQVVGFWTNPWGFGY